MKEEFGLNRGRNLEEMKDPRLGKAITSGRREAPTGEMNIAQMIGLIIGLTTITRMISEGKVISLTKPKIIGGKMDTPTVEAPEDLSTMTCMSILEA